jgi:formate C-acetyltransferase
MTFTISGCHSRREPESQADGTPEGDNSEDRNVEYLDDPYSQSSISRIPAHENSCMHSRRAARTELCAERPKLLTDWYRKNGSRNPPPAGRGSLFSGRAWRSSTDEMQEASYRRLHSSLPAPTTANPVCGVIVYPDAQAVSVWGVLHSMGERLSQPLWT